MEVLKPSATLLIKLGSLVIHIEEAINSKVHNFDITAIKVLLQDGEIKEWLKEIDRLSLLPKKRQ